MKQKVLHYEEKRGKKMVNYNKYFRWLRCLLIICSVTALLSACVPMNVKTNGNAQSDDEISMEETMPENKEADEQIIQEAFNGLDLDVLFALSKEQLLSCPNATVFENHNSIGKENKVTDIEVLDIPVWFRFDDENTPFALEIYGNKIEVLGILLGIHDFEEIQKILGEKQIISVEYGNEGLMKYVLHYTVGEYTYAFSSVWGDGEGIEVLIFKEGSLPLADTGMGLQVFAKEVPEKVIEKVNSGLNLNDRTKELVKGYSILDFAVGDLNGDGIDEVALVIQQDVCRFSNGSRRIYILEKGKNNSYSITHINNRLLLGAEEGGILGDPYSYIRVNDKLLQINEYGGSALRWSNLYSFGLKEEDLILKNVEYGSWYNGTGGGISQIYDFSVKMYTLTTNNYAEELAQYSGMKLLEIPIEEKRFLFDDITGNDLSSVWFSLPVPDLDYFSYGKKSESYMGLTKNAQYILDNVKEKHFPDMKKVLLPWTPETKTNFNAIIGYELPDYYYKDENGILYYYKLENAEGGDFIHVVYYCSDIESMKHYYKTMDSTGEEYTEDLP